MTNELQARADWIDELERGLSDKVDEIVRRYRQKSLTARLPIGLPSSLVFVDTEATGVTPADRMVSLAAIRIETQSLADGVIDARFAHVVCNPGRRSHAAARRIHGYRDRMLQKQPMFGEYAREVHDLLESSDLLVAHNATFDRQLIAREFDALGLPALTVPSFCTMEAARTAGLGGRLSLGDIAGRIGLARRSHIHDAAEDAWLTMRIFLWMVDRPVSAEVPASLLRPSNLQK